MQTVVKVDDTHPFRPIPNRDDVLHHPHWSSADPRDHAVQGVVLRPLACWDCGFESRGEQGTRATRACCAMERKKGPRN